MSQGLHWIREQKARTDPCQDLAEVLDFDFGLLMLLADGASGMPGGYAATQFFYQAVSRAMTPSLDVFSPAFWTDLLFQIDTDMYQDSSLGECTAIVLVWDGQQLFGVSAGDSNAWLAGARGIVEITAFQDHKRLGSGRAFPLAFAYETQKARLLCASDGLRQTIPDTRIHSLMTKGPLSEAAPALMAAAQNSMDDLSLLMAAYS